MVSNNHLNWQSIIDAFMKKIGQRANKSKRCLYYFVEGERITPVPTICGRRYWLPLLMNYEIDNIDLLLVKPTLDTYLKVELVHHMEKQLLTMSLSGYISNMAEKFEPHIITPMIPNTVLKTVCMVKETAAERDCGRKFPLT